MNSVSRAATYNNETTNSITTRGTGECPYIPMHLPEALGAPLWVPPPLLPASPDAAAAASPASATTAPAPAVRVGPAAPAPSAVRHDS